MLHDVSALRISGAARLVAHDRLDQEFLAWHRERFTAPTDEPIQTPKKEARRLVALRYEHDPEHALYLYHANGYTTPACQRNCDGCHRVLALLQMRELCETRSDYLPILNWIMDPSFLV